MCGLIGFMLNSRDLKNAHERGQKLKALMWQGLFVDTLRGADATGIARVDGRALQTPATIYKRAMAAPDFLQMRGTEAIFENMTEASIMIGHNRSTTRGYSHKNSNAHPFQVDNITLAHNGTLTNYHSLTKRNPAEVDSAYITGAFADRPALDVLPELDGAYALVWHDATDGTLNIAKNGQRPLAVMYFGEKDDTDGWEGLAFCSEMGMLWWLMDRLGIPKADKFQMIPSETIVKLHPERYRQPQYFKYSPKPKEAPRHFTPGQGGTVIPLPHTTATGGTGSETASTAESTASSTPTTGGTKTVLSLPGGRKQQKGSKKLQEVGLEYGAELLCYPVSFTAGRKGLKGIARFDYPLRKLTLEVQGMLHKDWNDCVKVRRAVLLCCTTRNDKGGKKIIMAQFKEAPTRPPSVRVVPQAQFVTGPQGYKIPIGEFLFKTEEGCDSCGGVVSAAFADSMLWIPNTSTGEKKPICHECAGNPMVRSLLEAGATGTGNPAGAMH